MCTFQPPFQADSYHQLQREIFDGRFARIPEMYGDKLWACIKWMLMQQENDRPTAADLYNFMNLDPYISPHLRHVLARRSYIRLKVIIN